MSRDEIDRLRLLLRMMVQASGRTHRDIERSLHLGHGYLSHLFAGRLELKFKHVFLLGEELGFSPGEFFQRAYSPPPRARPARPLEDYMAVFGATAELRTPQPGPPADLETLRELIGEAVTNALREDRRRHPADGGERDEDETPPSRARRAS